MPGVIVSMLLLGWAFTTLIFLLMHLLTSWQVEDLLRRVRLNEEAIEGLKKQPDP